MQFSRFNQLFGVIYSVDLTFPVLQIQSCRNFGNLSCTKDFLQYPIKTKMRKKCKILLRIRNQVKIPRADGYMVIGYLTFLSTSFVLWRTNITDNIHIQPNESILKHCWLLIKEIF